MRRWLLLCLLVSASFAQASDPTTFAGHYGHGATHEADEVVWTVATSGDHWRILRTADGEAHDAYRLLARGRETFWTRMGWPADSSKDADCMSWGQKPASLEDLLADTPPAATAAGEDYGLGVLCRVPLEARIKTGWLGDQASDWFYYDPIAGVIELTRLR